MLRSSRPEVFSKRVVLKNFAKFTGKYLCQGLFSNKAAEFCRISKNTFFSHISKLLHVLRKQRSIKIDGLLKKAVPQNNCSSVAVKIVYFCITEAVPRKCSVKKVFLKISQRLQKNAFDRVQIISTVIYP